MYKVPEDILNILRTGWSTANFNNVALTAEQVNAAADWLIAAQAVPKTVGRHKIVTMNWEEAYPASSGIKCIKCGKCSLGWLGSKPSRLSPGCHPKATP